MQRWCDSAIDAKPLQTVDQSPPRHLFTADTVFESSQWPTRSAGYQALKWPGPSGPSWSDDARSLVRMPLT